ncbi:unnamed protein product [Adineta ricciae]|uniref:Uncharacterized protein n=1 Tax=Adineta ricciae TaxID=249248 RepID=A0A814TDW8_ADIRI|nr:unnamed protein product [Adineta ricciae]
MCAHSVSGSSLLSGYDEDDARETSGRSRREFDQIDAVLYGEEAPKRSNIKKICEEWSSRPHFRIRGQICPTNRQEFSTSAPSLFFEQSSGNLKMSSYNFNEINTPLDEATSGRSSIDSIEGSELTANSDFEDDLDDANATNTYPGDRFSNGAHDSFDTDDDDDENGDCSSDRSPHGRAKHPQFLIKCLKDSIITTLASALLQQFFSDQQSLLQRYAKQVCAKNSVILRRKIRPTSLPPHPASQNRLSLPTGSSTNYALQQYQTSITSLPFRSTPEPNVKLTSLLRVTPLRITNPTPNATAPTSPRKSQGPPLPPPPPNERAPTSLTNEKRNQTHQQQISLVGTAVGNLPVQLSLSTPQTSHIPTRPAPSPWRYRSATTLNSNTQNLEPITRLPPITIERLFGSEQSLNTRSNTISTSITDAIPPATRAVSGTSTGSNASIGVKPRLGATMGKLQRVPRPFTITSTKDLINSSSMSPTRTVTTTSIASTAFRTTAIARTHHPQQAQQQKRSVLNKPPPPSSSSGAIKVPATRIC